MSEKIGDGGPAFPGTEANGLNSGIFGMSLRDYFAAKAMAAKIQAWGHHTHTDRNEFERCDRHVAERAYAVADAMLAAREAQS